MSRDIEDSFTDLLNVDGVTGSDDAIGNEGTVLSICLVFFPFHLLVGTFFFSPVSIFGPVLGLFFFFWGKF